MPTQSVESIMWPARIELANMVAGDIGMPKIPSNPPTKANSKKAGKYLDMYFGSTVVVWTLEGYRIARNCINQSADPPPKSKLWDTKKQIKKARSIKPAQEKKSIRDQQREWFIKTGRWIDRAGNVTDIDNDLIKEIKSTQSWAHPDLGTKKYSDFYKSRQWLELRYLALSSAKGKCACCGATSHEGAQLHVDHIKPRSRFPGLELSLENLQVLCSQCNLGKGSWGEDDWRHPTLCPERIDS